jgi:predicted alpha/beta hydrolase family esterase
MTILLLPGLGGSGPGHWQALWRESSPEAELVEQDNWNAPDFDSWIGRVAAAADHAPGASSSLTASPARLPLTWPSAALTS